MRAFPAQAVAITVMLLAAQLASDAAIRLDFDASCKLPAVIPCALLGALHVPFAARPSGRRARAHTKHLALGLSVSGKPLTKATERGAIRSLRHRTSPDGDRRGAGRPA